VHPPKWEILAPITGAAIVHTTGMPVAYSLLVSGSTRSDRGRKCRDTFLSLKKTCRKLGISFWDYLTDRVYKRNEIPQLAELVRQRAQPLPA
jgi:hypothetical protein